MKSDPRNLAIALAGIFQAVKLVQQIANGEPRDPVALNACITGIFNTSPDSADTVFGGLAGLRSGLEVAANQISGQKALRDADLTRYAVTVLYLERKLHRQGAMLERVRSGVDRAREQAEFFEPTHPGVLASLADCYKQTISTLRPRILVSGDQNILGNPDNQNLVRTLLLAAMRSAVLWRQCGGGRLTLILRRKALLEALKTLLREAQTLH